MSENQADCVYLPYAVVHHKQGVYSWNVNTAGVVIRTPIRHEPLGDHLAPNTQSAGAFAGHDPPRSLGGPCEWTERQHGKGVDAPSHQEMNRCMRPRFQICLETNQTPHKIIYQIRHIRRRHCICQGVAEESRRIVAAEPVR